MTLGRRRYVFGGVDLGTLTDPAADRLFFWDDSADQVNWLTAGSGLSITDTALNLGDLTSDWTISTNGITLTAGTLTAGTLTAEQITSTDDITAVGTLTAETITAIDLDNYLVAHYKMNDDAASAAVVDNQGYSNGTAQQNTENLTTTGKVNEALTFNGTSDYIDANNSFETVFQDSFTVSLWCKPTDGQPSVSEEIFNVQDAEESNIVRLYNSTDGKLVFMYMANDDYTFAVSTNIVFSNGQEIWHHIVVIADSTIGSVGGLKIYFDSVELELDVGYNGNTGGITFADYANDTFLLVGAHRSTPISKFFAGPIDNVMIFNKVLSQTGINYLYNSGNGTEDADTGAITGSSLTIGGNTLTTDEWAILDGVDANMVLDWTEDQGATNIHPNNLANSGNWDIAYAHSQIAGGDSVHVSTTENTKWDTAYDWGDHSVGGYLKADGSVDLTDHWVIATKNITLTAGTLTADWVKDDVCSYLHDGVLAANSAILGTVGTAGVLWLLDTTGGYYLKILAKDNAYSADYFLEIDLQSDNRVLTISGDSTINQDVSTGGTPSFSNVTSTAFIIGGNSLGTSEWAVLDGITSNQVIDWTAASSAFSTSGTLASGQITVSPLADSVGLTIKGFDDLSTRNMNFYIAGDAKHYWQSSGTVRIRISTTDVGFFHTGGFGFFNNKAFDFGESPSLRASFVMSTAQTPDNFMLGLDDDNKGLIVCNQTEMDFDYAHAAASDPTIFIHSNNRATDEWISLTHDRTNGVIGVGTGAIVLPDNVIVGGTAPVSLFEVDGAEGLAIETVTGNTTLDATHSTLLVNATGNVTITLPTAASAYNSTDGIGRIYNIKKIDADADTVTVDGNDAELIDGAATAVLTAQWEAITIQSNGTSWYIL